MRKIFFLAFVAIALVSCRKNDDNGNEINVSPNDYTLSADGLTLIKWTNSSTISIDMQGDSNLRKVNTIAENAFKDLKSLRAITFSDNLKEIGSDAFSGTNLSDGVNFNSYSDIVFGERVFYRSNIRKVVLPNTKALSNRIFAECRNLKEVTFKRTGIIGDGAFSSCGTLELVDLTDAGVTHIGKEAFANCKLLKKAILSVTMNLKTIGDKSFAGDLSFILHTNKICRNGFRMCVLLLERPSRRFFAKPRNLNVSLRLTALSLPLSHGERGWVAVTLLFAA